VVRVVKISTGCLLRGIVNNLRTWLLVEHRKVVLIVCHDRAEIAHLKPYFVIKIDGIGNGVMPRYTYIRSIHGLGMDMKNDNKIFFKTLDEVKKGYARGMEPDMLLLTSRVTPSRTIMNSLKIQARKGTIGRFQE
jgi:hypothetical protein